MDVDSCIAEAISLTSTGDFDDAVVLFERILTVRDDPDVLSHFAECLLNTGEEERAVQLLQHAVSKHPDEGYAKYMMLAERTSGTDAVKLYHRGIVVLKKEASYLEPGSEELLELQDDLCRAYCAMAEHFLTELSDLPDALARCAGVLQSALTVNPTHPEVLLLMAAVHARTDADGDAARQVLGRAHTALTDRLEAEAYEPEPSVLMNFVEAFMGAKMFEEASSVLQFCLELDDECGDYWALTALCASELGDFADARQARQLALQHGCGPALAEQLRADGADGEPTDADAESVPEPAPMATDEVGCC